jgi:hypothetical protein
MTADAKNRLDLVGVQEVRWDRGGNEPAGNYMFYCENRPKNHELYTGFFYIRKSYQQSTG